jgi:hypothetical protein
MNLLCEEGFEHDLLLIFWIKKILALSFSIFITCNLSHRRVDRRSMC